MVRTPAGLIANVVVNLIFSLVIGIIFLQVNKATGVEACQNRIGVLFFLAVNIMFSSQEIGNLFAKERILYARGILKVFAIKKKLKKGPLRSFSVLVFLNIQIRQLLKIPFLYPGIIIRILQNASLLRFKNSV